MKEDLVSVVMAVKNEEQHIAQSVRSILAQGGVALELIVVDDGSTDKTAEILKHFSLSDGRVKIIQNKRIGKVAAFNCGVRLAGGHYICLFAGDDIMPDLSLKSRLIEAKTKFNGDKPEALFGYLRMLRDSDGTIGKRIPRSSKKANFSGASGFFNRHAIEKIFPIPETLPSEDSWIKVIIQNTRWVSYYRIDKTVCFWRVHSGNSYNRSSDFNNFHTAMVDRNRATKTLLGLHSERLNKKEISQLRCLLEAQEAYAKGSFFGIIISRINWTEKIRLLASAHPLTFFIRKKLRYR